MIRFTFAGSFGFASSSAQASARPCVRVLISTTGCFGANAFAMSVLGTIPELSNAAFVSRPGTFVTIIAPGLKPSLRL